MKYLTTYKLFESDDDSLDNSGEILKDLKDICLELEDQGLGVSVRNEDDHAQLLTYKIGICKRNANGLIFFKWEEIGEVVERINDYNKIIGGSIRFCANACTSISTKYFELSNHPIKMVTLDIIIDIYK